MKRKNIQNSNGISISDSIIMSVKQKHANLRKLCSSVIAVIGFISVIIAFLGMYGINYSKKAVVMSGICILAFYVTVSVVGGRALWLYGASVIVFLISVFKNISVDKAASEKDEDPILVLGFKFIYNVIYKVSFDSKVNHYTSLEISKEIPAVTTFFIFYMWLLAIVICFFTICRPNPVLPILVTFPIIEIGLYNGVKIPVFWGMLCIAYWFALMAMSTIDVGEYSGGQSGFVRKNNLFFPKRHMKLKVTEKCGMIIICSVMATAFATSAIMKLTNYERSDSINQKRRDISDAVEDFSFINFGDSISRIINAFGVELDYDSHKLGTSSRIRYKNVTDLTITLDEPVSGPLYLKDCVRSKYDRRSKYDSNEWFELPSSAYDDKIFEDFKYFGVYPQDFALNNYTLSQDTTLSNHIEIKPCNRKKNHVYVPYFSSASEGHNEYIYDTLKIPLDQKKGDNHYIFCSDAIVKNIYKMSSERSDLVRISFPSDLINDSDFRAKVMEYCRSNDLLQDNDYIMVDCDGIYGTIDSRKIANDQYGFPTILLKKRYNDFARKTYLDVPDNKAMAEVHALYSDVVDNQDISTAAKEIDVLEAIKNKMAESNAYSLNPGKTPSSHDFVNDFLLERHKGFCIHFATAGIMLARMAGIPARYATGYVVVENDINTGKKNNNGSVTVNVKDNRSHAWAEVYLEDIGWVPYEFTPGYSSPFVEPKPTDPATTTTSATTSHDPSQTTAVSTSSSDHSTQVISTQVSTSYIYTSAGKDNKTSTTFQKWISPYIKGLKKILKFICYCILAFIVLVIRRHIILRIRKQKLTTGKAADRVINIYSYAEKLLGEMNMHSEMSSYVRFADEVEHYHGGVYFDNDSFRALTDIALRTRFSETAPTNEEAVNCLKFVEQLSENLYNKSSLLRKLKIRYISVLR